MVFQNYALYPHMTVRENMAFSLHAGEAGQGDDRRRRSAAPPRSWPRSALLDRYPRQLSGGQRQRVAMGRAIVRDPQVFLFDEPLSNLDAKLRVAMRSEIKELHQRLKTTSIYVTHDQIEAMTMGDQIVVMRTAGSSRSASPLDLYDHPANLFVAGFIGSPAMNFLPGTLRRDGGAAQVELDDGTRCRRRAARRRQRRPAGRLRHAARAPDAGERRRHPGAGRRDRAHRRRHASSPAGTKAPTWPRCSASATTSRPAARSACMPDLARAHLFDADSGAAAAA